MAETIRDYLVTLGFKVEKADEARFKQTLESTAKVVAGLAAGMVAAAGAIQAAVVKISSDFDSIYFASQRTGASVANIKSLTYALSQVGGSSGQAQSAIEGVAAAIRTNPGIEGLLNSLGVATRENGKLRDTSDIIDDIVKNLSSQHPYYTSAQIAGILGIDEKTFQILVTQWPKIKQYQDEYKKRAAEFGVDPDKAAESSNKLMTSFRQLLLSLELVTQKIAVELQPLITKYLGDFATWVQNHSDDIVRWANNIVEAVRGLIQDLVSLVKALEPVTEAFIAMTGSLTGAEGLEVALKAVLVFMTTTWIAGMLGALTTLLRHPAFAVLAAGLGIAYDVFGMSPEEKMGVGGAVNDAINGKSDDPPNWFTRQQNKVRGWFGKEPVDNKGNIAPSKGDAASRSGASPDARVNPELKSRFDRMIAEAPEEIRRAISITSGYRSPERQKQPFEEAVRKYGSEQEARKYVAPPGRSQHNSGEALDLRFDTPEATAYIHKNASRYGLHFPMPWEPWHIERTDGPRQKRSDLEQVNRAVADISARLEGANLALSRPGPLGGSITRSASIQQTTRIEITGSTDPAATAVNLENLQPRANAELLRNAQTAFM